MHRSLPHRSLQALALALALGAAARPAATEEPGSLAAALAVLQSKKYVDLTHAFGPSTPVWSGFGPATLAAATDPRTGEPYTIPSHGFRSTFYSMVGQYGTHVDPPAHFRADGLTLDQIPLEQMILPLVVFDLTPFLAAEPSRALTVADIAAWEKAHGRVPAGAFAALRTDLSKEWVRDPARLQRRPFPGWSLAAVVFLFEERGLVALGHESLDTDSTPGFESETWLLQHNHYQIEALANLDQLPPRGAVAVVTWPKVERGLGFPARVFAILP